MGVGDGDGNHRQLMYIVQSTHNAIQMSFITNWIASFMEPVEERQAKVDTLYKELVEGIEVV